MRNTPKGLRLHIGIFGRRNVGKSSLLNALTRQEVSIVSHVAGTTTDPVEKPMELLPLGPVLFIDTAGIDDLSALGRLRVEKTRKVFERTDVAVVVARADRWDSFEEGLIEEFRRLGTPAIAVFNKIDLAPPSIERIASLEERKIPVVQTVAVPTGNLETKPPDLGKKSDSQKKEAAKETAEEKKSEGRESGDGEDEADFSRFPIAPSPYRGISELREALIRCAPESCVNPPTILGDLVPAGEMALLVVPVDLEAPKGRLILPQVQVIRDLLDHDAFCMVTKDSGLEEALGRLKRPPALVVTDSQAFRQVADKTPESVPLTSFSILFARFKGDLDAFVRGALAIEDLRPGDPVLIAESCTHHPIADDIGRVKIPAWLSRRVGGDLDITHVQGHDFPADPRDYKLVVHCGACMWNRREMLTRILYCRRAGTPVTNYGLAIAYCLGIFERALGPFPDSLSLYRSAKRKGRPA